MENPNPLNNSGDERRVNPFLLLFLGPIVAIWELTKMLVTDTYFGDKKNYTGRAGIWLPWLIGTVSASTAGIGTGYYLGWQASFPIWKWVSFGVLAAVGTFVYIWPGLYLWLGRFLQRLSGRLWRRVNISGDDEGKDKPAWFTITLLVATFAAIAVLSIGVWWHIAVYVHDHQTAYPWLGKAVVILTAIVFVSLSFGIARLVACFSTTLAWILILVGLWVVWHDWQPLAAWVEGMWTAFGQESWGRWGYVAGALIGFFPAAIVGGISGASVVKWRVRIPAVLLSAAAVSTALLPTRTVLLILPVSSLPVAVAVHSLVVGLEFVLCLGFLFPILHMAITHGCRRLREILTWWRKVYREAGGGYREFFLQAANLFLTAVIVWHAPVWAHSLLGWHNAIAVYGLSCAVGLASYVAIGKVLYLTGSWPIGVISSAWLTDFAVSHYLHLANPALQLSTAAAVLVVFFGVGFPGLYLLVRYPGNFLSHWLRDPLVNLHARACRFSGRMLERLFSAADKTYDDTTAFRGVFLQFTNLLLAFLVEYVGIQVGHYLSLSLPFVLFYTVVSTSFAYLVIGKVLNKWGNYSVGIALGIAAWIYLGAHVYAMQPFPGWKGYLIAGGGGLIGAGVMFGLVFPWVYQLLWGAVYITGTERFLDRTLVALHAWCWAKVSRGWNDIVKAYGQVKELLYQSLAGFRRAYAQVKQQLQEAWEAARKAKESKKNK